MKGLVKRLNHNSSNSTVELGADDHGGAGLHTRTHTSACLCARQLCMYLYNPRKTALNFGAFGSGKFYWMGVHSKISQYGTVRSALCHRPHHVRRCVCAHASCYSPSRSALRKTSRYQFLTSSFRLSAPSNLSYHDAN